LLSRRHRASAQLADSHGACELGDHLVLVKKGTFVTLKPQGKLISIGGGAMRPESGEILATVVEEAKQRDGRLLLVTAATYSPALAYEEYANIFAALGLPELDHLDIRKRDDGYTDQNVQKCNEASVIFFTGGDQLRIASQMGDSPVFQSMFDTYMNGGAIAGTSAGAMAMARTMIIGVRSRDPVRKAELAMAPGLGLLENVVIDSHFAERWRLGRLMSAVALNPRNLGIGIDEATAIVVEEGERFRVLGAGGVYIVDGRGISYSSLGEDNTRGAIGIHDLKVHLLGHGDCFDLVARRPVFH
jgi:cyanophycinase